MVYEKFRKFLKYFDLNAIKMNLGDLLNNFSLNFLYKNDLFDRKTPFLAKRKLRITNIKLKIAIKLKILVFMVILRRFGAKH